MDFQDSGNVSPSETPITVKLAGYLILTAGVISFCNYVKKDNLEEQFTKTVNLNILYGNNDSKVDPIERKYVLGDLFQLGKLEKSLVNSNTPITDNMMSDYLIYASENPGDFKIYN
jgi:hypothetical protein